MTKLRNSSKVDQTRFLKIKSGNLPLGFGCYVSVTVRYDETVIVVRLAV